MKSCSAYLIIAMALAGCASPNGGDVVTQPRGWEFVESVGGIKLGEPHRSDRGRVTLPLECDLSGSVAGSGWAAEAPVVRSEPGRVLITLVTSTATKKHHETRVPPAELGSLAAGSYEVIYRDPQGMEHPLGSIQIGR